MDEAAAEEVQGKKMTTTHCIECGAKVEPGEYWCSGNCFDIWTYPALVYGTSTSAEWDHRGSKRPKKRSRLSSAPYPGEPIDFGDLPF